MEFLRGTEDNLFSTLAGLLFTPTKQILDKVEAFKKEHFMNKFVVGLQVRSIGPNKAKRIPNFFDCYDSIMGVDNRRRLDVVFYLATDSDKTRKELVEQYPQHQIIFYNETVTRETDAGNFAAIVDIWLLSQSDLLIVSGGSTFGRVAYTLGSHLPFVVPTEYELRNYEI